MRHRCRTHNHCFEGVSSRREALRILAAKAASLTPGEWVMVQGGWMPRQFADSSGGFTLQELGGVAPKNPLFVPKKRWPAEIMNEYGKLAAAARSGAHIHGHVIDNSAVTDLLDTLEKVIKNQRIDRLRWTMGPRLFHLSRQHRSCQSIGHDAWRPPHGDASRRSHAAQEDRR